MKTILIWMFLWVLNCSNCADLEIRRKGQIYEMDALASVVPAWENMNKEELEKQYSASRWSKRYNESEIIEAHVEEAKASSEAVRKTVPGRLNVSYGDKERMKLDVFGENLAKDSYIMVYVHGGYWQELEKDLSLYPVKPLYENGVLTVIVGYTLAPQAALSEIVEEIRKAVDWSCTFAKTRGSKGVVLMGWSAGAHLITEVISTTKKEEEVVRESVRGIITLAGVFDIRPLVFTYVNDNLHLDKDSAWGLSPMWKVVDRKNELKAVKFLVAFGENDSPEFQRQSTEYYNILKDQNLDATLFEVDAVDHFNLVEELKNSNYTLTKKIIELFFSH